MTDAAALDRAKRNSIETGPLFFDAPIPAAMIDCGVWTVLPEWIDFNGHMNVGFYGVAFDRAVDVVFDHWLDIGEGYVAREGMGPFALQTQGHYLRELKLDEQFRVTVLLVDSDAKRAHFFAEMRRERDGELAATTESVSLNVDLTARRAAPYPERQRARIAEMVAAQSALPRPPQLGAALGLRRG